MKVRVKKLHPDAVIPKYAKAGDAGLDLVAVEKVTEERYGVTTYHTGLSVEIPEGHVGLIFPRSSIYKSVNRQANCVGVIDSGYRGEIMVKHELAPIAVQAVQSLKLASVAGEAEAQAEIHQTIREFNIYEKGDRVGQLIILPYPQVEFEEVEELSSTDRGEGGFGHTGA